jgi:hypothetical protein
MRTLRARIHQQQVEAQVAKTQAARKEQVFYSLILPHLLLFFHLHAYYLISFFVFVGRIQFEV